MKIKYRIEDNVLMSSLKKEYGIQAESIHFIPVGDSAYSYWVNCGNGERYYLKLFNYQNDRQRRSIERLQHYLPLTWSMYHNKLFQNLTFPIKTLMGEFEIHVGNITIVLFNFIEGETLADAYPFSKDILIEIARSVASIHRMTPYIDHTMLLTETFDDGA
ncbi:hypothetical protein [Paenibacillus spongiae]|uniref:Aminoglycoside phosphotransferase domain-containing protein n=1 Tax=Paenibacillus spongiae TaxID=2909671 RepID=A0ABY5SBA5_9BACL|nr:hypothetical protein [Paenibacillus spongiae]UVI30944.1 hypothetical protein L1F29_03490 [Paenibacillus spongiae]